MSLLAELAHAPPMSLDLEALLPLYAVDALEGDDAASLEAMIAQAPHLQPELAALRDSTHEVVQALTPIEPPPHLVVRLMASIGHGPYDQLATRFAALFDLGIDRARELLGWIHDPGKWHPATPGVSLIHFRGGPSHVGADCGIIRIAPGSWFPWHAHVGEEVTLFLAGTARDHEGTLHVAGGELVQTATTAHDFSSVGESDLVFAVRYRGVDFAAKKPQ